MPTRTVHLNCSDIPPELIDTVTSLARDKWRELGRALGFEDVELYEYDASRFLTMREKAHQIVCNWMRRDGEAATVGRLLEACDKVGVGGNVRRTAHAEHLMQFD